MVGEQLFTSIVNTCSLVKISISGWYTTIMAIAYTIKRRDEFFGKKLRYGESGSNRFIRLAKKGAGSWKRPVHEVWDIKGITGELKTPIDHISPGSIGDFVTKLNYYTTANAQHLFNEGVKASFIDIIFYPKAKFIQNYFLKQGFRDGTHGFVHAMLMS